MTPYFETFGALWALNGYHRAMYFWAGAGLTAVTIILLMIIIIQQHKTAQKALLRRVHSIQETEQEENEEYHESCSS